MINFEKIYQELYRLKVPFENIYTAVFLIKHPKGDILFDCATTEKDVKEFILPALWRIEAQPKKIFCSHSHGDHMGGLPYLLKEFPNAVPYMASEAEAKKYENAHVITDGAEIAEGIKALILNGHSPDSAGIIHAPSATLLTFDAVQLYGVGRYGSGISEGSSYKATLRRLKGLYEKGEYRLLIASHEYYPLGSTARDTEIPDYLKKSEEILEEFMNFATTHKSIPCSEMAKIYNSLFPCRPPIGASVCEMALKS